MDWEGGKNIVRKFFPGSCLDMRLGKVDTNSFFCSFERIMDFKYHSAEDIIESSYQKCDYVSREISWINFQSEWIHTLSWNPPEIFQTFIANTRWSKLSRIHESTRYVESCFFDSENFQFPAKMSQFGTLLLSLALLLQLAAARTVRANKVMQTRMMDASDARELLKMELVEEIVEDIIDYSACNPSDMIECAKCIDKGDVLETIFCTVKCVKDHCFPEYSQEEE